jgi:hypothetical protein
MSKWDKIIEDIIFEWLPGIFYLGLGVLFWWIIIHFILKFW